MSSHLHRRFGGKVAALAVGAALALTPAVATAAPATPSFGTAPLATPASSPSGPVAGFEDNAARAVYWLLNKVEADGWGLDRAIAVAGAGYGEAVREEVLEWAKVGGVAAAGTNLGNNARLAQVIGIYGENPATFIPGNDLEAKLRTAIDNGSAKSIYVLPFVIWGLTYTEGGVPQEAIDYLTSQQCANGLFGFGCNDTDTSGWVIQALLAAGVDPQDDVVLDALDGFAAYKTEAGGYVTNGASVANTNSSAIVSQALRAAGDTAGADQALNYIGDLQIGWVGTGAADVGQIAQHQSQFDSLVSGIPAPSSSVAMVSNQVPAAFGVNPFGAITADGSISERPNIPLVFPEPYGETKDADALLVAHFLQTQIIESNGQVDIFDAPDWGGTLDALISLAALGTGSDAADVALTRLAADGKSYAESNASAAAKVAYTLLVYGKDPRTFFDGYDLLESLREEFEPGGSLLEDADVFGRAFGILALERTIEGAPVEAVVSLEQQRCSDEGNPNFGGYDWGGNGSCAFVDADTTSLALQALAAAGGNDQTQTIEDGLAWLVANVNSDGAIESWGEASANSTSWAGQAFSVFGLDAANGSRNFLKNQVIKPKEIDASTVLKQSDAGLVPASPGARSEALAEGTELVFDTAMYATVQAGLGLGDHGLAALTALGAAAAAPSPEFAPVVDDEEEIEDDDDNENVDEKTDDKKLNEDNKKKQTSKKKKSKAADAKNFDPKYAG